MSGGYFDYDQYKIFRIADDVEQVIINYEEDKFDSYNEPIRNRFTPEEIEKFREAEYIIRKAAIYAQRIDWLLSGDDDADSFFRRLKEELEELDAKPRYKSQK